MRPKVAHRGPFSCPTARPENPSHCQVPNQETTRGPVRGAGLSVRRQSASSATDSSDFTGADVSGGAVLAGSIGSRPPRGPVCRRPANALSSKSPLELWGPFPPHAGFCATGHQGSAGRAVWDSGGRLLLVPCEVSHLPCGSRCHGRCRAPETLRKLSNCGIKSGPAANELVVMSANLPFKLCDYLAVCT